MTNQQLKSLEDKLWDSANAMRAYGGIKSSDYAVPVLGLIFLRFAENKYAQHEDAILAEYARLKNSRRPKTMQAVAIAKCGFYLPDNARYDYLLHLAGNKRAEALKAAMEGIEKHLGDKYQDVLPKNAYFDIEKKKEDILPDLLKTFDDIPRDASGDIFGKIYEYFLGKFAMAEGQKGGQFFTPTSVVRFIVEVIEPYSGSLYDPACGSGGMFVQSAKFVQEANRRLDDIYVHGQEFMGETVRLAKMNLLVNNIRGDIFEVNSYGADPFGSFGKFDYVMANPPFNVKSVKEATVKDDPRFTHYGLPKTKNKKDTSISDANYLWVSLFATSLNETGRAGFVMPNSASDARGSEEAIRRQLVDSGIVDVMVSMPSNMFLTVTLPATLWFLDKAKAKTERRDQILFIDARNTFHQIDRAHREWQEEQVQNLAAIVRLYRGETDRFLSVQASHLTNAATYIEPAEAAAETAKSLLLSTLFDLKAYLAEVEELLKPAQVKKGQDFGLMEKTDALEALLDPTTAPKKYTPPTDQRRPTLHRAAAALRQYVDYHTAKAAHLQAFRSGLDELLDWSPKNLKIKNHKGWNARLLHRAAKELAAALSTHQTEADQLRYFTEQAEWLQSRFPDGKYVDVTGLCKLAGREEYVDEQEYSLNAGRYVGVEIEEDKMTEEEFNSLLEKLNQDFKTKCDEAIILEKSIFEKIANILK